MYNFSQETGRCGDTVVWWYQQQYETQKHHSWNTNTYGAQYIFGAKL